MTVLTVSRSLKMMSRNTFPEPQPHSTSYCQKVWWTNTGLRQIYLCTVDSREVRSSGLGVMVGGKLAVGERMGLPGAWEWRGLGWGCGCGRGSIYSQVSSLFRCVLV